MKPWKDVTLTDDYLFSQIMKDEDFCKLFLEMLMDSLLRGNPYDQLKKSYVIFICNFDLCGDGLPVYESRTVWKQNGREIGDEQIKVVYNTSAFEKATNR